MTNAALLHLAARCPRRPPSGSWPPYRSRAWYPFAMPVPLLRRWLWYVEPVLKVLVPAVAVSMELVRRSEDSSCFLL